jgi:hypothetical protein
LKQADAGRLAALNELHQRFAVDPQATLQALGSG